MLARRVPPSSCFRALSPSMNEGTSAYMEPTLMYKYKMERAPFYFLLVKGQFRKNFIFNTPIK